MSQHARKHLSWTTEATSFALRFVAFFAAWWIMAEGRLSEYTLPFVFILIATASSRGLCPPRVWRWNALAVVRFIPWFLWNSFLGGLDVALRAFRPSMPLKPEIVDLDVEVSEKPGLLMAWVVSLLPGTACIYLEGKKMRIHVLDTRKSTMDKTRDLERRLGKLCE